jgi:hypothetical protein
MAAADIISRRRRAGHVARRVIPPTLAAEVAESDGKGCDGRGEGSNHVLFNIKNNLLNID